MRTLVARGEKVDYYIEKTKDGFIHLVDVDKETKKHIVNLDYTFEDVLNFDEIYEGNNVTSLIILAVANGVCCEKFLNEFGNKKLNEIYNIFEIVEV